MPRERFYLLKVAESPDFTMISEGFEGEQFGLFRIQEGKEPVKPIIHSSELQYGFKDPSELGVEIGKFFRDENESMDSFGATEQIEAAVFPIQLPHMDWHKDPVVIFDRLGFKQYSSVIVSMTKELDGE